MEQPPKSPSAIEMEQYLRKAILTDAGEAKMPFSQDAHWPSGASVRLKNGSVLGKCHRALGYDWMQSPRLPSAANNRLKAMTGISMEGVIQFYIERMGFGGGRNKKAKAFNLSVSGPVGAGAVDLSSSLTQTTLRWPVSLEFDMFVRLGPGKFAVGEIKCKGGRHFVSQAMRRIPGVRSYVVDENLLQVMLYLHVLKIVSPLVEGKVVEANEVYLFYIDRDTCALRVFKIVLDQDGYAWIEPSGEHVYREARFTVYDILKRYALFENYATTPSKFGGMTLPPREFVLTYDEAILASLAANTELLGPKRTKVKAKDPSLPKLTAVQMKQWERNQKNPDAAKPIVNYAKQPIGDFQCAYCDHCVTCWGEKVSAPYVQNRLIEIPEEPDEDTDDANSGEGSS